MPIDNEVIDKFNHMLIPLCRHMAEMLNKDLKGGINLTQLLIMKYIVVGVMNTKDIAENLNLSAAAISKMVDQLCEKGYVKRERTSEDRRVVTLINTEQGKEILKCNNEAHREALKGFIAYLDVNNGIEAFESTIKSLYEYLEAKGINQIGNWRNNHE